MNSFGSFKVGIMITTRNRLGELQRTGEALKELEPQPDAYCFTADGCEDETANWLREEFPSANLFVNDPGLGSVVSRDRMLRSANMDLVLALDDDSFPLEIDAIERLRKFHQAYPDVAVSTFPQKTEEYPESLKKDEFESLGETSSFPNSGACFRADIYRELPGFPACFYHAYEEPDYALQCQAAGYRVYHTNCITIRHRFTWIERNEIRTHHRHARNEVWSAIMRCPFPQLPLVVGYRIVSQLRYALRRGPRWVVREPVWCWDMLRGLPSVWQGRQPVAWRYYKKWMRGFS